MRRNEPSISCHIGRERFPVLAEAWQEGVCPHCFGPPCQRPFSGSPARHPRTRCRSGSPLHPASVTGGFPISSRSALISSSTRCRLSPGLWAPTACCVGALVFLKRSGGTDRSRDLQACSVCTKSGAGGQSRPVRRDRALRCPPSSAVLCHFPLSFTWFTFSGSWTTHELRL